MRVGTLEKKQVIEHLSEHFVLVAHNQLPQLYCNCEASTTGSGEAEGQYPSNQMKVNEGAGGGNVRTFFCTPEGRVVNYLAGYWKEEKYRFEADWSRERIAALVDTGGEWWNDESALTELLSAHQRQLENDTARRDQYMSPTEVEELVAELKSHRAQRATAEDIDQQRADAFSRLVGFNRMIRSHREAKEYAGRPVESVLQQIEDEVYTKGAIGCGS